MSDDFMRTHLITKFKCTECGSMLKLSTKDMKGNDYTEGEPTGAAIVKAVIGIHPCEICMAPANELKKAVNVLLKAGK